MIKEGLKWEALHIGRRRFLGKALATTFGVMAALSVGQRTVLAAAPCSAPYGGGACGSSTCNGHVCKNEPPPGYVTCTYTYISWASTACWRSTVSGYSGTCCDCLCQGAGYQWYCYCYG